jgi:hypothetical protein
MTREITLHREEQEPEFRVEFRRHAADANQHRRRTEHQRRERPTGFNGIHRRRNKRWSW